MAIFKTSPGQSQSWRDFLTDYLTFSDDWPYCPEEKQFRNYKKVFLLRSLLNMAG